jgi:hypothetical protein
MWIDREGIFKVVPSEWIVEQAESGAIGIKIKFSIIEYLENGQWADWRNFGPYDVTGTYWVVKKDGAINTVTVKQLVESLGWDGTFAYVDKDAPQVVVQVKVEQSTYDGKTFFKAGWMNPGNYTPEKKQLDPDIVKNLDSRFGSLLRAAASQTQTKAIKAKEADLPF